MKLKTVGKFFKVVLLVVLCLTILAVAAGYLFLKTFDIKRYKPQIIAAATSALGRKVNFKDLDLQVSWNEGARLKLNDVTMSDDPAFQEGNFLRIEEVSLGADLWSYLTQRQVSLSTIRIVNPQIKIIRASSGELNVSSIGKSAPGAKNDSLSPLAALPLIFINGVIIENGTLSYVDRSQSTEVGTNITQLGFKAQHISLYNDFPFAIQAAVLSNTKNLLVAGTMKLNIKNQEVSLKNTKISFDLAQDSWEKIRYASNVFINAPLPGTLNGNVVLNVKNLTAGSQGLKDCKIDAELSNGNLTFKDASVGLALEAYQMAVKVTDFSFNEAPFAFTASAGLFNPQPNVSVNGTGALSFVNRGISLMDTTISSDLALLPLEKVRSSVAAFSGGPFLQTLKGKLLVSLKKISVGPQGLGELSVDADWTNGAIQMKDVTPGVSLSASQVVLKLTDFNFVGDPFKASFEGAVYGDKPNVSFNGTVQVDLKTQSVLVEDAQISSDLSRLPLPALKESLTALNAVILPEILKGTLSVDLNKLSAGPRGLDALTFDARLADGTIRMKDAVPGVSIDMDKVDLRVNDFSLGNPFNFVLTAAVFGPDKNISLEGAARYDPVSQMMVLKNTGIFSELSQISLSQLKSSVNALRQLPLPENLAGKLHVTIKELSAGPQGLAGLLLNAQLTGGTLRLNNVPPGVSVDASQIDFKVQDFSLGGTSSAPFSGGPFQFSVRAALYGEVPNVVLTGQGQWDLNSQDMEMSNAKLTANLSKISLPRLQASIAALKDVPLPQEIRGQLSATIDDLKASANGLTSLTMNGEFIDGSVKLEQLALPLESIHAAFKVAGPQAMVEDISMKLGEGSLKVTGTVDDYLGAQLFNADLKAQGVDLSKVIDQTKQPVKIEGILSARYQLKGQGFDPQKLIANLSGSGSLHVENGKLKDINLLKEVLNKLSMFPNLEEKIQATLPQKYQATLQQKDTILKKAHLDSVIENGACVVNQAGVEADGFWLKGQGRVGFDQTLSFDTSFLIVDDLSAVMVGAVKELGLLQNDYSQIQFPLKVTGTISAPKVMPDLSYITQMVIKNRGKQELQKLLKQAIGLPEESGPAAPSGDGQAPSDQGQSQEKPEQQLIKGILNSIFKK